LLIEVVFIDIDLLFGTVFVELLKFSFFVIVMLALSIKVKPGSLFLPFVLLLLF